MKPPRAWILPAAGGTAFATALAVAAILLCWEPSPPLVIEAEATPVVSGWLLGNHASVGSTTKVAGVQVDRSRLAIQFAASEGAAGCPLPDELRPPGGVLAGPRGTLPSSGDGPALVSQGIELRAYLCPDSDRAREVDAWLADRTREMPEGVWRRQWAQGMFEPLVQAIGVGGGTLAGSLLALALVATGLLAWIGARPWPGDPRDERLRQPTWFALALGGLLCLGVGLAFYRAAVDPLDEDEPAAQSGDRAVLGEDHDAFIHPPVFRALQTAYRRIDSRRPAVAGIRFRTLSVVATVLGLAYLTLWLMLSASTRRHRVGAVIALALCLAMTGWTSTMTQARPYGLASWWLVVVAGALFGPFETRLCPMASEARWRIAVAVMGAGLALWTDLVAGIVAGALLASWVAAGRGRIRVGALLAGGFAVWSLPLAPGAFTALVDKRCSERLAVCIGPEAGVGGGHPIKFISDVLDQWSPGLLGANLSMLLIVAWSVLMTWKKASWRGLIPLTVVVVLSLSLPAVLAMRARNVAYLPLLVIALTFAAVTKPEPKGS